MRPRFFQGLLALAASLPFTLLAQDSGTPATHALTLNDAVRLALVQDPEAGGLSAAHRAARETEAQAGTFSFFSKPPEIRVAGSREGYERKGLLNRGRGDEAYNFALRFFPASPWENKARKAILTARTTAARDISAAEAFAVEIEVRRLYFDALVDQDLATLADAASAKQKDLRDALEKLLSNGQALLPAVVKARANVVRYNAEAQVAHMRAQAGCQELVSRIGGVSVPVSQVTLSSGWPSGSGQLAQLDLSSLIEKATAHRNDLAALASEAASARAEANAESAASRSWLTHVEVGYTEHANTPPEEVSIRFGVSLPFGGPKNLNRLDALAKARALSEQHSLLRRAIATQVRDAHDLVRTSSRNWQELESQLAALRKDVADIMDKPESRQLYRPEDLFALQAALLEAEEATVRARHAAHMAVLALDAAVGESAVGPSN